MALPLAQQQPLLAREDDMPFTRDDILARYLRLREISRRLHDEALKSISGDALLNHAHRLGLARGKTLILDDMEEMFYVYDLAIYTAPADRSRAIDRYARSTKFDAQSDERLMLEAMRASQFAILLIERRHDTMGLIATDILRNSKAWLVDVGLESSMDEGELIATRLITPGPFSMTAGANVPFGLEMFKPVCALLPQRMADSKLTRIAEDRRFAEAVYRVELAGGAPPGLSRSTRLQLISAGLVSCCTIFSFENSGVQPALKDDAPCKIQRLIYVYPKWIYVGRTP